MEYNVKSTKIFFVNEDGGISFCTPTGLLDIETTAIRDLPNGTSYWIVDFETEEQLNQAFPDEYFFDAYELDLEVLGPPHGIALGYDEWAKLQPPGTLGL
jgi:hypothetical protein